MSARTPRRHILRPATASAALADSARHRRHARRELQLSKDRQQLQHWMTRLKRAFHTVERLQSRIARLERQNTQAD